MARNRIIHHLATRDVDVATMSMAARVLWAYLPCHADRSGRMKDSPFTIKAEIFPGDAIDVDALLGELAAKAHIIRYEVAGKRFIQIRSFARYQSPHVREKASDFPAPGEPGAKPVLVPDKHGTGPSVSVSDPVSDPVVDPVTPPLWASHHWLRQFKLAWEKRTIVGATAFYGDTGDTKASARLHDELERLPQAERLAAQARAPAMLAAFFAEKGDEIRRRHYPFNFFVQSFGALRMATTRTTTAPPERPPENPVPYDMRRKITGVSSGNP